MKTRRFLRLLAIGLLITAGTAVLSLASSAREAGFDTAVYQKFLDRYVKTDRIIDRFTLNVVDYELLDREKDGTASLYRAVLQEFNHLDPAGLSGQEERLAFWINAYNMGAIKMIMDHYPVDSIRSRKISWIGLPWGKEILEVGGRSYSLSGIEHDILIGELNEPLAHFGIVCASLSCPELVREAYTAKNVRSLLERQARRFLADPEKGLKIEREKGEVRYSQIFRFDKRTFPKGGESAVPLIAPLVDPKDRTYLESGSYAVKYLDYDWSLNALDRAR